MSEPIDVQAKVEPSKPAVIQAMTVRDAIGEVEKISEQTAPKAVVTAAQAKIEAVANLTAKAYERASELILTPDEIGALQADFPDEAFKPGAAGKDNLIYIEHAFLRDRLNSVFGPGQWALIPRSRWAEDFTSQYGKPASRVYVEAMLMVRGCFVAEAVGEMEYWKTNPSQNYGDAVEGAKTAALRRCCKEFGIGLQAWKKDWCDGWWKRRRNQTQKPTSQKNPGSPPAGITNAPPPSPAATGDGIERYPVVNVLTVKEVHSKPNAAKPWTAFFIRFSDGIGEVEAGTFDKKIAAFANELATTGESAKLVTRPGRKPNTKEVISLDRAEEPPSQSDNDGGLGPEEDQPTEPPGVTP